MIVALQEDGQYKCSKVFELEPYKREFMACRSVYSIRQRLGLVK
jgi:hypothetical protein